MQMDKLSASVEEACLNAWPALKEIFYDGWLIRVGRGETRRTNSVNVLGRGRYAMDAKIAYCDSVYRAHGLPTYFRIRSIDDPALERALDAGGFRAEDETRTLFMDFAKTPPVPATGAAIEIAEGAPSPEWLSAHARFTAGPPAQEDMKRRLLDLVALPVAFAAARDEAGKIVSVAYGAIHDGLVSLQWVATEPARRRQGLSHATLSALLFWAKQRGAGGACLQVLADNAAAIGLYGNLGFDRELYRYHYRVR